MCCSFNSCNCAKKCPKASLINVNTLSKNPMNKSEVGSESAKNQQRDFCLSKLFYIVQVSWILWKEGTTWIIIIPLKEQICPCKRRKLIRFAFCYNTYPNKMIRSEKLHTYFWVVMLLPSLKNKGYISFFAKHKSANGMLLPKSLLIIHKSFGEA